MAGSLLPVGKAVLRSRQPSKCYMFNADLQHPKSIPILPPYKKRVKQNNTLNKSVLLSPLVCQYRLKPVSALDSDVPYPIEQSSEGLKSSESFKQWDSLTAKFAGAANIPFLILQLPQIILNARNLLAGNQAALFAVPWLGMFTGLLGNLSLLSYFIKKRETEVVVVQTLGVVTIYVVISQLAMAGSMPLPHYAVTSVVIACGLVVNFMNYFHLLNPVIWRYWEDFITIAGLSALPQVMWSTFIPYVPNTILPGAVAFVLAILAVFMSRTGKLPEKGIKFVGSLSGWTATLLFMWMPVSQMWTNLLNPDNIKGLSALSMLLAMIGNGLMIPRALFTRDLMWFTGSTWACVFYGWGNLVCLYCCEVISREFFLASTTAFVAWLGTLSLHLFCFNLNFLSLASLTILFGLQLHALFIDGSASHPSGCLMMAFSPVPSRVKLLHFADGNMTPLSFSFLCG